MIRLERECEDFRDFGIKGCAPLCINRTQNCWSTGTITRDPTHEELQEIAGRAVKALHHLAFNAIELLHETECDAYVNKTCISNVWVVRAEQSLTYIKDGVEWNVKEGE
jgi:hypothetical protein